VDDLIEDWADDPMLPCIGCVFRPAGDPLYLLIAGDDDQLTGLQKRADPRGADLHDARLSVARVGHDPGLKAAQRDRRMAGGGQFSREERGRDLLDVHDGRRGDEDIL